MSDSNTAVSTAVRDSTIYVAVEVSRSSWVVAVHCPEMGGKVGVHTVKPSDTDALVQLIERARLGVSGAEGVEPRVVLTYEAGYFVYLGSDGVIVAADMIGGREIPRALIDNMCALVAAIHAGNAMVAAGKGVPQDASPRPAGKPPSQRPWSTTRRRPTASPSPPLSSTTR